MKKNRIRKIASFRSPLLVTLTLLTLALPGSFFWTGTSAQNKSAVEKAVREKRSFNVDASDRVKPVPRMVKNYKTAGVKFEPRQLFKPDTGKVDDDRQLRDALSEGVVLNLDKQAIQRVLNENLDYLNLNLPDEDGGTIELELVRVNITTPDFTVKTSAPTKEAIYENLGLHYRGMVKGNDRSLVAISVFGNEVMGFVSTEAGNTVLGRLRGKNTTDRHILYDDKNLKARPDFDCDTEDTNEILPESLLQEPEEIMARCVRIYLEATYDLFQANGSVSAVTNYLTGVFNQSAILYANEGISIAVSEIFVWNTPSPYTGANSLQQLEQFKATRTTFNGNLAHLVTLQSTFGGIAYRPGLCNTGFNYAFSGINPTFNNVPTYSWTVMVFTHETGHNFGSPHTHACSWNGNGTAIDGCAPTEPNSSCPRPGIPAGGGTMMSYCHLQSVGINFTLGFGTQPGNLILNSFNTQSCVADCGTSCTYAVAPGTAPTFSAAGGSGSFNVTTSASCSWSTVVNSPRPLESLSSMDKDNVFLMSGSPLKSASSSLPEITSPPAGRAAEPSVTVDAPAAPQAVFVNSTPITVFDRANNSNPPGTGSLYPSTINVAGMTGTITQVDAALNGLSHTFPDDLDVVLVGPGGQRAVLMSDAGGGLALVNANVTFNQNAGTNLPDAAQISTGTYRPGNFAGSNTTLEPGGVDNFPAPGPGQTTYASDLNVFNGTAPNGTWRLYVVDDEAVDSGNVAGGWALGITTSGGGTAWINVTSGSTGTGSGAVSYTVSANAGSVARSGSITVNGQVHTVNQAGAGSGCTYSITSTGQSVASAGGSGSFGINAPAGCTWSAASSNTSWLTTSSSGSGNGTIQFNFSANTGTAQRSATITVQGQTHTVTQAGTSSPALKRPFDFDGDGKTDVGIYRPSNGQWWINRSSNNTTFAATFGSATDRIVPADYTGDGKTDIAFWRPSTGEWFILRSENGTYYSGGFGTVGDVPAPGDFDQDGKADLVVFRPSNGVWYIFNSTNQTVSTILFGQSGDVPVTSDYDGDNRADAAVFRPATGVWWLRRSTFGVIAFQFGNAADKPAPGDYTGDGKADVAFFRPVSGEWYILRSENQSYYSGNFGASGDIAVPGDYDGDGKNDPAVFRPSNSTWYAQRSTNINNPLIQTFGIGGDRAVPSAFVP